jgi:alpha-glucosidase
MLAFLSAILPSRVAIVRCTAFVLILAAVSAVAWKSNSAAGSIQLLSPDGRLQVDVATHGALNYRLSVGGEVVLQGSRLGLRFKDAPQLGSAVTLISAVRKESDTTWVNPLGKRRNVRNHYREMQLNFRETDSGRTFGVVFRAFDDGIGFRYVLPVQANVEQTVIEEELTEFSFPSDHQVFAGDNVNHPPTKYDTGPGYAGSQEWEYRKQRLADLSVDTVTGVPALVHASAAWVAITEADLYDWSGMWLSRTPQRPGTTAVTLRARLAPRLDGDGLVKISLPHDSPWRVVMVGQEPGRLIESDLVLNLSTPSLLPDASWVKPGLASWDPWFSNYVKKDTGTMKDYIQLAADMHWPYQLIDGSWYVNRQTPSADITQPVPTIDMEELRRFAAQKNVRLWLWLYWTDVDRNDNYKKAFDLYEKWGIAGVKIDFLDRDDQDMVNWYEKITRYAASRHLMVNFHGAFKPTGMIRTWPNQITREGVMGNEYNKWSTRVTAEHRVTLPFTRFLAGPGDYTPGGFVNRTPATFQPNSSPAQVQGTRAGQLALFVVYESPLIVVADHPDTIRGKAGLDFLQGGIPTVWDDTRVLSGVPAEYLVIARRSNADWYLGTLTNSDERVKSVKLDFLGPGRWKMRWWHDASESALDAERIDIEDRMVTGADVLEVHMQPSGGSVAHFVREP